MSCDPLEPTGDPFKPPAIPTLVGCLHCGREYESFLIEWRVVTRADGTRHGFWYCPTPGCDGKGFGFDIFPVDPEYRDEDGRLIWADDEEEAEFVDDAFDETADPPNNGDGPAEPTGPAADEEIPW